MRSFIHQVWTATDQIPVNKPIIINLSDIKPTVFKLKHRTEVINRFRIVLEPEYAWFSCKDTFPSPLNYEFSVKYINQMYNHSIIGIMEHSIIYKEKGYDEYPCEDENHAYFMRLDKINDEHHAMFEYRKHFKRTGIVAIPLDTGDLDEII